MVEIRLFAGLREGRDKAYQYEIADMANGQAVLKDLAIDPDEVAVYLINGFDEDLDAPFQDGDVVSIFPAIGGG